MQSSSKRSQQPYQEESTSPLRAHGQEANSASTRPTLVGYGSDDLVGVFSAPEKTFNASPSVLVQDQKFFNVFQRRQDGSSGLAGNKLSRWIPWVLGGMCVCMALFIVFSAGQNSMTETENSKSGMENLNPIDGAPQFATVGASAAAGKPGVQIAGKPGLTPGGTATSDVSVLQDIKTNTASLVSLAGRPRTWGDDLPDTNLLAIPIGVKTYCPIETFCDSEKIQYTTAVGDPNTYIMWSKEGTSICLWYSFSDPLYMPDEICTFELPPAYEIIQYAAPYSMNVRLPTVAKPATAPEQCDGAAFCKALVDQDVFLTYAEDNRFYIYSGECLFYYHWRPLFYNYADCDVLAAADPLPQEVADEPDVPAGPPGG